MKKVLFVVTSCNQKGESMIPTGFNLSEVTHPLSVLEEAGIHVDIASIDGGAAPLDGLEDLNDPINKKYWSDKDFRFKIENTFALQHVDTTGYEAIFFAGGHGTMWDFPNNLAVQKAVREMYENNHIVSAVCHGPAALVNVRLSNGDYLVNGKKLAAFTNDEEEEVLSTNIVPFLLESELVAHGAVHLHAPNWSDNTVVDGRLITGQNPQSAFSVGKAILQALSQ